MQVHRIDIYFLQSKLPVFDPYSKDHTTILTIYTIEAYRMVNIHIEIANAVSLWTKRIDFVKIIGLGTFFDDSSFNLSAMNSK